MAIKMYDLAAADESVRFSPYCWRVKMALAHKGLQAEQLAWRFSEKDRLAFAEHGQVPVLCDGDTTVVDSWQIMQYLDERYPDKPIFKPDAASAQFFKSWVERSILFLVFQCIVADIHDSLTETDQTYFRETREARLGATLEDVQAKREQHRKALNAALEPVRTTVAKQTFIAGDQPTATDYLLFACFQFARCASSFQLLPAESAVFDWRERMLDLHDGYARKAKGFDISAISL